jgi:hypothetical protein
MWTLGVVMTGINCGGGRSRQCVLVESSNAFKYGDVLKASSLAYVPGTQGKNLGLSYV